MRHPGVRLFIFIAVISVGLSQASLAGEKAFSFEWVKEGLSNPLAAVSSDGSILVADDAVLYKLTSSGTEAWNIRLGGDVKLLEADSKGGCWAAFANGVARVLPSGKVSWIYSSEEEIRCLEALPDGRVLVGTSLGGLLLDEEGKFVWLYDPATGCDT